MLKYVLGAKTTFLKIDFLKKCYKLLLQLQGAICSIWVTAILRNMLNCRHTVLKYIFGAKTTFLEIDFLEKCEKFFEQHLSVI